MKLFRKFYAVVALCVLLCLMIQPVFATQQTDTQVQFNQTTLLGTSQLITNAKAVVLYEYSTETFMYAWNADTQMYPSSMVKIITAYYAVLHGNPEDVVTVTETALANVPYDAVSADLQPGEEILLEDLIYCMMVGSANDAASVIAEHIGCSEEEYLYLIAKLTPACEITMEETLIAASHSRWINNGSLAKCQGIFSADMADDVLRRKFLKK